MARYRLRFVSKVTALLLHLDIKHGLLSLPAVQCRLTKYSFIVDGEGLEDVKHYLVAVKGYKQDTDFFLSLNSS